jgi:hypothetical protein
MPYPLGKKYCTRLKSEMAEVIAINKEPIAPSSLLDSSVIRPTHPQPILVTKGINLFAVNTKT